ncbi:MAG: nucleotidyl transferase AbiEii/AbiGii toxin family protein [Anaerolineales bacterium]
MRFHRAGLNARQISILRKAGGLLHKRGFYLGGGTALAIYFGHRKSVDLDWFIGTGMGDALQLAQWLRGEGLDFITTQTAPGTLHGTIRGVRMSFLEFRYPLLRPLTKWKSLETSLASLDDLACMKLSAIAQRGQRKDFCDIYMLGTKHRPLAELLKLYQRKFNVGDISPVLYGLAYFDDADGDPMPRMLVNVQWKTIKRTIQDWVKQVGEN